MHSTKIPSSFPDCKKLKSICKAISVLDAILSPEWEYRYYSYSPDWGEGEECLQMRNGQGDEMHVLLTEGGCAINGFAHEYPQPDKKVVTDGLPQQFHEFIFGEPVASIGTTFCLWNTADGWKIGDVADFDNNSEEMLRIFDGSPQTYLDYASEYFEESFNQEGLPANIISDIYNGETLTKEMVLSIVDHVADWKKLEGDLKEIGYPFDFQEKSKKRKWKFW